MKPLFEDKGVGVGLRPAHYPIFLESSPQSVKWVEVISENFMPWRNGNVGKSLQTLEKIRQDYPVHLHGVSLNVASVDKLDFDYLKRLKILIDTINPTIVSDHLAWTGVKGENLHDLLPFPYTPEALTLISEKLDAVQNFLGRRILLENPSTYLEFQTSEITEWDFISTLLNTSDAGLLLDINNVYVSSVNHGFDPLQYLKSLPVHRIGQIHLAGHTVRDNFLIDTHDVPVCREVWDLYRNFTKETGLYSTMIERDGNIPEWKILEEEIKIIGDIRHEKI